MVLLYIFEIYNFNGNINFITISPIYLTIHQFLTFFSSGGKASACNAGDLGSILGQEDPLEKEMATHSSILAWRIPWIEEPGRLQSMGSQKVGHDWVTSLHFISTTQTYHTVFCTNILQYLCTKPFNYLIFELFLWYKLQELTSEVLMTSFCLNIKLFKRTITIHYLMDSYS